MNRSIFRLCAAIMALLMTVCLCGCEVDIDIDPLPQDGAVTVVTTAGTSVQQDAWDGGLKKTTTSAVTTTERSYATLPSIQRNEKYDNPYGLYHTLLAYTFVDVYSKNRWLPTVGYIKDGEICGVMYDSVILLPTPYHVYHSGDLSTKAEWDTWREHTYENFDTLNEAVIEVQNALDLKEYKIKVLPTLFEPLTTRDATWGELNGVSIGAKNEDERFAMVKYMVDSYITEFNAKGYSNLELAGFYWFDEGFDTQKGEEYLRATDYIHAVNKLVVHAPYYKSPGWQYGHLYGMDLVAMQSNYFHNSAVGQGTTGSIKRLAANAAIAAQANYTDGITVECSTSTDHDDMTTFKNTMKTALEYGTDDAYHVYYFGSGATAIFDMQRSDNAYIRSGYDELYRYIHQNITAGELWIEEYETEQEWLEGATEIL